MSSPHVALVFRVRMEPVFTSVRLKVAVLFLLTIGLERGESNFNSHECVWHVFTKRLNILIIMKQRIDDHWQNWSVFLLLSGLWLTQHTGQPVWLMLSADDPTVIPLSELHCRQSMKRVHIMWVADRYPAQHSELYSYVLLLLRVKLVCKLRHRE